MNFGASGGYPNNNDNYLQEDGTSVFDWNFGDGTLATGQNTSHTFTAAGIYNVNLEITDIEGCESINDINLNVFVSDEPIFDGTTGALTEICLGEQNTLTGIVTPTEIFPECSTPPGGVTFLPDGGGGSFERYGKGTSFTKLKRHRLHF